MKKEFIALLDSGVGGISTLLELKKLLPNENYLYLGDNENAPYGDKSIYKLKQLLISNLCLLNEYNLKCVVVACNTLSVSLKGFIEDFCGVKTFGVYPSVQSHIFKNYKTLLLATTNTARKYQTITGLKTLALPKLAIDIENNINDLSKVNVLSHLKDAGFNFAHYDSVILGCTHYYFIKNQIIDHLKPQFVDCCSSWTAVKVKSHLLKYNNVKNTRKNQTIFIGNSSLKNQIFYNKVVNAY